MNDHDPINHASDGDALGTTAVKDRPNHARRLSRKKNALILGAGACAVAGIAAAGMSTTASAATVTPADTATPTPTASDPARTTNQEGGSTGIVDSISDSSFTFTTATGVEVTALESSATVYDRKGKTVKSKALKTGQSVLVLGLVNTSDITATEVTIQTKGDGGAAAAESAGVIAFVSGEPSPVVSVGTVPPEYVEGEGTLQSGAVADEATAAAQAVVPGGIVDRVNLLSGGEYEVHNISINWPHEVFLDADFNVIGWGTIQPPA